MTRFLHNIIAKVALVAALCISLSSCSMMEDDNKDCPTGLYVRFVYDYNIAVFIYDSALLCLNLGHILSYLCT